MFRGSFVKIMPSAERPASADQTPEVFPKKIWKAASQQASLPRSRLHRKQDTGGKASLNYSKSVPAWVNLSGGVAIRASPHEAYFRKNTTSRRASLDRSDSNVARVYLESGIAIRVPPKGPPSIRTCPSTSLDQSDNRLC